MISLYANEINECLLMVGGTIMSNKMWTSTQSTQFTYSWYYDINIQGDHLDKVQGVIHVMSAPLPN